MQLSETSFLLTYGPIAKSSIHSFMPTKQGDIT